MTIPSSAHRLPVDPSADAALNSVLTWIRRALHPSKDAGPTPQLALDALAVTVRRHQLAPFFAHALPGAGGPAMLGQNFDNLRRALRRVAILIELGGKLDEAGIPWLAFKGPVLAAAWWGAPERRRAGDLDLAVPLAQVRETDSLLRGLGWRRTKPDFELTPRQWNSYLKHRHELGYISPSIPDVTVEIQWRLDGVPDLASHLAAPHRVVLAGRPVPTLPSEVNLRFLCRHGAKHAWSQLFWLLDVAHGFRRSDVRWSEVVPGGRSNPCYRAVAQASLLAEELLGIPAPSGLLPEDARQDPAVRWLAAEATVQMSEHRSPHGAVTVWLRQLRYRTVLEPGLAGRWRALAPHCHSPLHWKTLPLPDRWFWLYPVLGPFLWLARVIARKPPIRSATRQS